MLKAEGYSLQGERHGTNQDSYAIQLEEDSGLVIVADGMGGHRAGDTASKMAIELIVDGCQKGGVDTIRRAIDTANQEILRKGMSEDAYAGMGTTVVLCMIQKDKGYIAHVGDSRAYLLHNGELTRLTRDHSLVEDLISHGEITAEEAQFHPMKNIITMALGVEDRIKPDFKDISLHNGDSLLLCSDGFSNVVPENVMKDTLLTQTPKESVTFLCEEAKRCGSTDDITVIVLQKSE